MYKGLSRWIKMTGEMFGSTPSLVMKNDLGVSICAGLSL